MVGVNRNKRDLDSTFSLVTVVLASFDFCLIFVNYAF